nr:aminodeoxychorismate synthase component I [Antarcticibacterium sp. W02-3]
MLSWSSQFTEVAWLDSNDYPRQEAAFDAILAAQAFTVLRTDHYNAFENLKEYQETTADWIFGYLSYDLKNDVEDLSSSNFDGLEFPDLYFFQPTKLIQIIGQKAVFHYLKMVDDEMESDFEEIGLVESGERREDSLDVGKVESGEWREDSRDVGKVERGEWKEKISHSGKKAKAFPGNGITSRISKEQYLEKVGRMLSHIHRGDIYEANFCQEFFAENRVIEPLQVFQKLNDISVSPFAVYLKLGEHHLLSASPERYIKKKDQKIYSQPIKGTAPRSANAEEDEQIAANLVNDPKERSENIMIVDLVRNDLSRIARRGTVRVEELCKVYSFKQVHQMISTISAEVDEAIPAVEILRATFPMGSMTGAPKISAMKIIEELEETKRGLYSGAVGYFNPQGDFDFNVVIRSILYNSAKKYVSFSVGGAITSKSIPEKEYEECLLKARAMRQVLS